MADNEILSQILEMQKQLSETVNQLVDGQKQLFNEQRKTNERLDTLEKDVKVIKITLENDISPSQKMLSEFLLDNSKRLRRLERDIESVMDELVINDVIQGIDMQRLKKYGEALDKQVKA